MKRPSSLPFLSALLLAKLLACASSPHPAPAEPGGSRTPPFAERRPVTIRQHGFERIDPYAWLRDPDWQAVLRDPNRLDPNIRAHLEAENRYYETSTAGLSDLRRKLFLEMKGRVEPDASTVPLPDGSYAYSIEFRPGGEYPIYVRAPRSGGEKTILYDGDRERGAHPFFDIAAVEHSPDHVYVAYGVDRLGSEYYDLRIRVVETGRDLQEVIPSTDGKAVWTADAQRFFYIERDDHQRPRRVKLHTIGTDPSSDLVVHEENDPGMFLTIHLSQSRRFLFLSSGNGVSSETSFVPSDAPTEPPVRIAPRVRDELYDVEHHGDYFYIRTNRGDAVDFEIVRAPIESPGRAHWVPFVPHRKGRQIIEWAIYHRHFVRLEVEDALPRLVVSTWNAPGQPQKETAIAFTEGAYALGLIKGYEYETKTTRFSYESFARPVETVELDLETKERRVVKTQRVPSGHDPSLYRVERINATAPDGEVIPISIIRLKSTPLDGTAPALLYGYGSYGIFSAAEFSIPILSLVDRGAVYALAHVRGGSAKGRAWYLGGKLENKMRSFTDLNAAAEALIEQKYADPRRIVLEGISAGGLLVGAAVNLRPELYAGVVAQVPFVDVLSTISDESLPLTPPEWDEWGNPLQDPNAYGWMAAYSPYDNIKGDVIYPPILATGGLTDYRVTYWEPAKWIARLRAEARGGPFLLRMNMAAGHAGSAARFEQLEARAHEYAFALERMGLADVKPVRHAAR